MHTSSSSNPPKPASPQETAGRIAALHGAQPARTTSVQLIGTKQVSEFVSRINAAQASAQNLKLNLG